MSVEERALLRRKSEQIAALKAQRDALVAALESQERFLTQWDADNTPPTDSTVSEMLSLARAALEKARKEN